MPEQVKVGDWVRFVFNRPNGAPFSPGDVAKVANVNEYGTIFTTDGWSICRHHYEPCDPPSTESPTPPQTPGLTARQYAAIHLRVPDSGDAWLDEMIERSRRDVFAGQALAGMFGPDKNDREVYLHEARRRSLRVPDFIALTCMSQADAMLAAEKEAQS